MSRNDVMFYCKLIHKLASISSVKYNGKIKLSDATTWTNVIFSQVDCILKRTTHDGHQRPKGLSQVCKTATDPPRMSKSSLRLPYEKGGQKTLKA